MKHAEDQIVEIRLESARQQIKLAIAVGITNLVAFGIVEFVAMWLNHGAK